MEDGVAATVVQHSDRLVRDALACAIEREIDLDVVGMVSTPASLVSLCEKARPDIVVIELDAAGWDAPKLATSLRKRQRWLHIVGVFEALTREMARRAHTAGVRSTVSHSAGAAGVVAAVRGATGPERVVAMSARTSDPQALTPREVAVLRDIAAGSASTDTARDLGLTVKTIETHKQRIFRKLDAQNQAHAVAIAIRAGILGVRSDAAR